jgi:hypothetical protein
MQDAGGLTPRARRYITAIGSMYVSEPVSSPRPVAPVPAMK